jgi:hypothetical protein
MANILNNANAGYHIGTMCLIYRVIRRVSKPLTESQLTELCWPSTLFREENHKKKFKETLDFWKDDAHCLWKENPDLTLSLLDPTNNDNPSPREISDIVRRSLFAKKITDITVNIRSGGTRDGGPPNHIEPLLLHISALLASGEYLVFGKKPFEQKGITQFTNQYLEARHILNGSEDKQLFDWLLFLGFMENQNGQYWIDPSRSISHALTEMMTTKQTMDIRKFITLLGELLPVFDGGEYQKQTATVMEKNDWSFEYPTTVSAALSHALFRLQVANIIKLVTKSDDQDSIQLIHPYTRAKTSTSQIIYVGGDINA